MTDLAHTPVVAITRAIPGAVEVPGAEVRVLGDGLPTRADVLGFVRGASAVVREAGIDVAEMGQLLRERVPFIISRTYEPYASTNVLDAQLEDIISAMESSVSDEGLELRESIKLRAPGEQML